MNLLKLLVRNVALLWLLIVALLALLWVVHRRAPGPLVPPAVQKTLDSLRATRDHDASAIAILRAWADSARTASDSAQGRARVYEGAASRIGSRADTYAAEARKSDPTQPGGSSEPHTVAHADSTARLWKAAYEERTYERDTLLLALKAQQRATLDAQIAADKFRLGLDASEARRRALESLNDGLADALSKANRGCRVLWMKCPSREAAAIGGVIVGGITTAILTAKM